MSALNEAALAPPRAGWLIIARLTLREAVSRRLVLAAVMLSVAFVALFSTGLLLLQNAADSGILDAAAASALASLALYALHFLTAFLALLIGAGAVSSDLDSGALHALLARPITRRAYLLGRWAGLALLLTTYVLVMGATITGIAMLIADYSPQSATLALLLLVFEAVLLLTVALLASTRLSTVASGVAVFCLFSVAWIGGFIETIGDALGNTAMTNLGIFVSLVMPSDALWRGASYYSQSALLLAQTGGEIPFFGGAPPAPTMIAWAGLLLVGCLLLALRWFGRRDL